MFFVIVDDLGRAVSFGTVVGALPAGWTAVPLTGIEYASLVSGEMIWQNGVLVPNEAKAEELRRAANETQLIDEVSDQIDPMLAGIAELKTIIGSGTDVAGTNTLQALGNFTNATILTPQNQKALIGFVVDIARELRDAEREVVRLSRIVAQQLDSTDSGGA